MGGIAVPERVLHDAVVVVPGVMGSALRDVESGKLLWGVRKLFAYSARMHTDRLRMLAVTDSERAGRTGRVETAGLLKVAEWMPGLGGAQPYNELVSQLRSSTLHPSAVLPFAYDWRLSVEHNGAVLAKAAREHLAAWRGHPAHRHYCALQPEAGLARLIFVAHSMGGLLVRELVHPGGPGQDLRANIRAVLTIGTPFGGSVKAAVMMNSGKGAPLLVPSDVLREVTPTMPGLYDLLPSYRALVDGADARVPGVRDVVALGGRRDLAELSVAWRESRLGTTLPGHSMMVGVGQRTAQSYRLEAGMAIGQEFMFMRDDDDRVQLGSDQRPLRENRKGDGTVYQYAAHLRGTNAPEIPVFQGHTDLARSPGVIDMARGLLRGLRHPDQLGTMLGNGRFGLEVPDLAELHTPFTVKVTGRGSAADVSCVVQEVSGRGDVLYPELKPLPGEENAVAAPCLPARPGLYEVKVVGGVEPVTRLVLVAATELDG